MNKKRNGTSLGISVPSNEILAKLNEAVVMHLRVHFRLNYEYDRSLMVLNEI